MDVLISVTKTEKEEVEEEKSGDTTWSNKGLKRNFELMWAQIYRWNLLGPRSFGPQELSSEGMWQVT